MNRLLVLALVWFVGITAAAAQSQQRPQENWLEVLTVPAPSPSVGSWQFFLHGTSQLLAVSNGSPPRIYSMDLELQSVVPGTSYIGLKSAQLPNKNFVARCPASLTGLGRESVCEVTATSEFIREIIPIGSGPGTLNALTAAVFEKNTGRLFLYANPKAMVLNSDGSIRSEFVVSTPSGGGSSSVTVDPLLSQLLVYNDFPGPALEAPTTVNAYSDMGDLIRVFTVSGEIGNPTNYRIIQQLGNRLSHSCVVGTGFAANSGFLTNKLIAGSRVQFVTFDSNATIVGYAMGLPENTCTSAPFEVGNAIFAYRVDTIDGANVTRLVKYVRAYKFAGAGGPSIPDPTILKVGTRPGQSIVDLDYVVADADSPAVAAYVLAVAPGARSLSGAVRLGTLIEGTGQSVGASITTGSVHRVSWDAGSDIASGGFRDLRFLAYANDSRPLVDLHFVRLPPGVPGVSDLELFLVSSPIKPSELTEAWLYLVASADPQVVFDEAAGTVTGAPASPYAGQTLAAGTSTTSAGLQFLWDRIGVCAATQAEIDRGRGGTTPGVQQYLPEKRVGRVPDRVNEVGVDTGTLTGHWVRMRTGLDCT